MKPSSKIRPVKQSKPRSKEQKMIEMFQEASFEMISKSARKKEKEVEMFSIPDSMDDVERALFLLKNGTSIQRESVYSSIGNLFKKQREKANSIILSYFCDVLWKADSDLQLEVGKAIEPIFPFISKKSWGMTFVLFKDMIMISNSTVRCLWRDLVYKSIFHMPLTFLLDSVVDFAMEQGDLSESDDNRAFCARILEPLAMKLSVADIEDRILDQAIHLCQDTYGQVRFYMAKNVKIMAKKLGKDRSQALLQELYQLLEDETKEVQHEALTSLIELTGLFDREQRKSEIIPIYIQIIAKSQRHELYKPFIDNFGPLIWNIHSELEETHRNMFRDIFVESCQHKDIHIRRKCAYHFPGVVKSFPPSQYCTHFFSAHKTLSEDADLKIKNSIASSFHHVLHHVSKQNCTVEMKDLFLKLLKDKDDTVKEYLIEHLYSTLKILNGSIRQTDEIITPVLDYESVNRLKWRKIKVLFEQLEKANRFFSKESLQNQFIPMVRSQLLNGNDPIKVTSARVLVGMARNLCNYNQQVILFKQLIQELCRGKSCSLRMTFLDLTPAIIDKFSRQFFKTHCMESIMCLSSDPIPNVRIKFCRLMPKLKQILSPSTDVKWIAKIKERSSFLMLDKDRDVMEAAKLAFQELETLDLEMARGNKHHARDEALDRVKEQEEKEWIETEKESEKNKRRMEILSSKTKDHSGPKKKKSTSTTKKIDPKGKKKATKRTGVYSKHLKAKKALYT